MDTLDVNEPPSKRVKLSSNSTSNTFQENSSTAQPPDLIKAAGGQAAGGTSPKNVVSKELEVGISAYVNSGLRAFKATLKKRYTDFLVNEVLPNGEVLHLRNLKAAKVAWSQQPESDMDLQSCSNGEVSAPQRSNGANGKNQASCEETIQTATKHSQEPQIDTGLSSEEISIEDKTLLISYFGESPVEELIALYQKILSSPEARRRDLETVKTAFTSDRSIRGQIHQNIRRIFNGKIDSSTNNEGILVLSVMVPDHRKPANQPGRNQWKKQSKPSWADRGGDHLHFTLYKENKDTMEVIYFLGSQLKISMKMFQFAGTKDRRAVTAQRVSVRRVEAERLAGLNRSLRNSSVGDFEYQQHGLELGDLKGNEFVITLRDCHFDFDTNLSAAERLKFAQTTMGIGLSSLRDHGFFNYYGLQRFGTFATRTDTIGIKLLQSDFKGACKDILHFSPDALVAAQDPDSSELIGRDDKARAHAIDIFNSTGNVNEALNNLPKKFSAEATVIRNLGRYANDYAGALMGIQRNLRLMYVHAYQSFIWNMAVGARWELYGNKVVEGDLIMINEHKDDVQYGRAPEDVDADGEAVVQPGFGDRAHAVDDVFERARPLTAEEASSSKYTIFDVVLPQPGYDILYPRNQMSAWYKTFMGSERGGGLDPHDMRRRQNDYSLSGAYRKILARIEPDYSVEVRAYRDEDEQFVATDLAKLQGGGDKDTGDYHGEVNQEKEPEQQGDKIAVILKFQLQSSQYATMALRELSKGGIVQHKPDFSGGR